MSRRPWGDPDITATLSYMDQGSFLGLRALGRGPVIQYTWIYDRGADLDGLRRLQAHLRDTLLGRCVERSPLPFGRHRWVVWTGPAEIDIEVAERRRDDVWEWVFERARVPVDPESGPPWHLGVQPLIGGGDAVTLVVSHTVADAAALSQAIAEAVDGPRTHRHYPPPGARPGGRALREDLGTTLRSAADLPAAVIGAVRTARQQRRELSTSAKSAAPRPVGTVTGPVDAPVVVVSVALESWDKAADRLGGTPNALFAGIAAPGAIPRPRGCRRYGDVVVPGQHPARR